MSDVETLKNLIRVVRNRGDLDYLERKNFIEYLEGIRDGKRNNPFYETDFLNSVVLNIINSKSTSKYADFLNVIKLVGRIISLGMKTENYEVLKGMIINGNHYIDMEVFGLFENPLDYIMALNMIESDEFYNENYDHIATFAKKVAPYCTGSELKKEIVAYITDLKSQVGSIEFYTEERVAEAKKRCGIYDVDEKKLALIAHRVAEANTLVEQLETLSKQVMAYEDTVKVLIDDGKDKLNRETKNSLLEIKQSVQQIKSEALKAARAYQEELMADFINSKDEMVAQVIATSTQSIEEIQAEASSIFKDVITALNDAKAEAKETLKQLEAKGIPNLIARLKEYDVSIPEIKQRMQSYDDLSEAIAKINTKFESTAENMSFLENSLKNISPAMVQDSQGVKTQSQPAIYVTGNNGNAIPCDQQIILPDEKDIKILPAFDESITFEKRFQKIMERKKKRIAKGELFHEKTDDVVACILECDWPYLFGPSGCGKSYLLKQAASLIGLEYVENGKILDNYSVMGVNDVHGRFRASQLFRALVYGKLLILDEFDNGNTDTQVVLNQIYSDLLEAANHPGEKYYVTFGENVRVAINPNFRVAGGGNTTGEGADKVHSARGKVDESVLQRMTPIYMNYDNRLETATFANLYAEYGKNKGKKEEFPWADIFFKFRGACLKYADEKNLVSVPGMITTRDAVAICKYIRHNSKSVDAIFEQKFTQIKDAAYLNSIIEFLIEEYSKQRINISRDVDYIDTGSRPLIEIPTDVLAKKLVYSARQAMQRRH